MASNQSPLNAELSVAAGAIIRRLQDEIAQQEEIIEALRAEGHLTADAEKHLRYLKESLDMLR